MNKSIWKVNKTGAPNGGWLLERFPDGESNVDRFAFRTLSGARDFIKTELSLGKRVRMTKHSEESYSYRG